MTNKLPKHINHVPDNRKAVAPYNFVELPDKIVEVDKDSLPSHDRYYGDRYTGKVECTLTTSSPLYIRCGYTLDEYADFGEKLFYQLTEEQKSKRADFFKNPSNLKPVIPGSSLRGMLRTLIEIITFSKIDRVSDEDHFFFRAVATTEKSDSLAAEYKKYVKPDLVKAGYLKKDKDDWLIHPSKQIKSASFAWIKESSISLTSSFLKFNDLNPSYQPQYLSVGFTGSPNKGTNRDNRYFLDSVNDETEYPTSIGTVVTSGNMKQGSEPSPRRNHCVVFQQVSNPTPLMIDPIAVQHYCNALTDFQKASPFSETTGFLANNRPVFYSQPQSGKVVGFFGQSPNFRIPFSPEGNGHAATARDFIPTYLKDPEKDENRDPVIDIAEAIFGYVRGDKRKYSNQSLSGRIFVSDANCVSNDDVWFEQEPIIPHILASPKPTTFQHYLVQKEETKAEKPKLKHYAHKPVEETVIRGHKLYWHKGSSPNFKHPEKQKEEEEEEKATQITKIKLIKTGISFKFTIHFENLSNIELGALSWVLDTAQNDDYRLSLGMGKPLGMGAIKIEHQLYLSKRQERYNSLFSDKSWASCENLASSLVFILDFKKYMVEQLQPIKDFKDHRRIKMLLSMLKWNDVPQTEDTRYMEIERDKSKPCLRSPKPNEKTVNEYKDRLVLPSPLDVRESDRKINREASGSITSHPAKPILKKNPNSSKPEKPNEGNKNAATARPPKPTKGK
ncbi:TIGR03986 family CRISPR-associated RAMP protein [Pseudanabaena sp. FACHB-1277]|uniref:TIGR03986 family CRISPR-associated RAMP protein n=1 Tax=Pseudanabaena cinerea FACHB-1277 TaxID=2949581 RepID=A0A926Z5U5_9CYAN|nr:TIGR03986 family CRISPR-associated RAMP protein [Pseudanabaena cinerea]MBD2150636.1 TIGR03986 family CRISPR-associated RAMP protein [Pseudanabaena cinerea FACHB-1277]